MRLHEQVAHGVPDRTLACVRDLLTAQAMGSQATLGNGRAVGPLPPLSSFYQRRGWLGASWPHGSTAIHGKPHRRHLLRESHHGAPAPQSRWPVKGVWRPLAQRRSPGQWPREDLRQEDGLFTCGPEVPVPSKWPLGPSQVMLVGI